jgi:23S rRNA-/tRNA-specific pseudouridylate synthase
LAGQMLCAKRLTFWHPVTGQKMMIESKMEAAL